MGLNISALCIVSFALIKKSSERLKRSTHHTYTLYNWSAEAEGLKRIYILTPLTPSLKMNTYFFAETMVYTWYTWWSYPSYIHYFDIWILEFFLNIWYSNSNIPTWCTWWFRPSYSIIYSRIYRMNKKINHT